MKKSIHKPSGVELDELLAAEFEYIAQTALQANEDRARVSSFYLIAVGSLVAALLGAQYFDPATFTRTLGLGFSGLFLLLTFLGYSTVMQLARLRSAWHESVTAMNQMKDFAIKQDIALEIAFRWTTQTIPPKYKKDSVSHHQAVEVSLVSGLMFSAAIFFLQLTWVSPQILQWLISVSAGIVMVFIQMRNYKRSLK